MTHVRDAEATMAGDNGARGTPATGSAARMECKVCWYVYDPAVGDEVWQVPAGTPWRDLPPHWSCPVCSTTMDSFLVMRDN